MLLGRPTRGILLNRTHPLARGLVGCWLMNEGTGGKIFDLSRHGRIGNFSAGAASPSWGPGKFGQTVLFDGNDKVTVTDNLFSLSANCSFMVWASCNTAAPNYECPFNFRTRAAFPNDLLGVYFHTSNQIHWWCGGAAPGNDSPSNVWTVGQLHCFIVTHDSAGNGKLYVDGVLVDTAAGKTWTSSTTPLMWFGDYVGGGLDPLNGQVELAMLWDNVTLSASQARQICRDPYCVVETSKVERGLLAGFPFEITGGTPHRMGKPTRGILLNRSHPISRGLVGCWLMNEGCGKSIFDLSGNGNSGSLLGSTHFVPSNFGTVLDFDGSGDRAQVGDKTVLEPAHLTLLVWARTDDYTDTFNGGVAKGLVFGAGGMYSYKIDFHSSNGRLHVTDTSNNAHGGSIAIGDNNWHMWALTYDGVNVRGYKDAILGPTAASPNIDYTKSDNDFTIGAQPNGSYSLDGQIALVMEWNRALSISELTQLLREPACVIDRASKPALTTVTWVRYPEMPPFMQADVIDPYSGGAWLWLCEIAVPGYAARRIARNTEDIIYGGNTFDKFNLQIGDQMFSGDGSIPRVTLKVFQDVNRVIEDMINATEGALGAQVKLIRVNEKYLNSPVTALEADYDNLASESDSEWITFTLGVPNPLSQRCPLRSYSSKSCPYAVPALFKGPECQYTGDDGTCTGSYEDCFGKGNAIHWGGELGLDANVVRI